MNRCPNHQCRVPLIATHCFCYQCGIAVRLCPVCQQEEKETFNRGDGFYCRRCGNALPSPPRGTEAETVFEPSQKSFHKPPVCLTINERTDTFPLISSQGRLWLLTSNNNLKIMENRADSLSLYSSPVGKNGLEELQKAISYLEPQTAPAVFIDRLLVIGTRQLLSFSIHPHASRWLRNRYEIELPTQLQPLFGGEIFCHYGYVELPVALADTGQFALLRIAREQIVATSALTMASVSLPTTARLIGALDSTGHYYWAKDLKQGTGTLIYIRREQDGIIPITVNCPPLLFFARPVTLHGRVYAVTQDNRLIELVIQRGEVIHQRKLNQVERGARALLAVRDTIIIAVHEELHFFDTQTGALRAVAADIDASHLFADSQGTPLAIHRNGQLVIMNSANPLERWGNDKDATSDDSRVSDAFIAYNSLYTLSENGEVCRFDLN
ncbi:MAG: PQQ-binding-like beta-propeller repeat protein [Acidobacteriota bacterium]